MAILFFLFSIIPALIEAGPCTTIAGKVSGGQLDEIGINIPFHHYRIDQTTRWTEIGPDGQFSITLDLTEAQFAFLRLGDEWIKVYVEPEQKLIVELDTAHPENPIQFHGKLAAVNTLLQSLHCGGRSEVLQASLDQEKNAERLWDQIQKSSTQDQSRLETFLLSHSLSQTHRNILSKEIHYFHLELFYQIGREHVYVLPVDTTFDKTGWLDKLENLFVTENLQDASALNNLSYFWWIGDLFDWEMRRVAGRIKQQDKEAGMAFAADYFGEDPAALFRRMRNDKYDLLFKQIVYQKYLQGAVLEKVLAGDLYTAAALEYFATLEEASERFSKLFPKSRYLPAINRQVLPILNRLEASGAEADITFLEAETEGWNSLSQLLDPFRGKIILVDLWYSTCGPCRREFGHLPALKTRFADQELVYLYISVDRPHRKAHWQETVRYFEVSGIHVLANEALTADIWQHLAEPRGLYPRYFIVDRQGKIVVDAAPLPSAKQALYQLIEEVMTAK